MKRPFTDKRVWLIGATAGIGAPLARLLAVRKARVLLSARPSAALTALEVDCQAAGALAASLPFDLLDEAQCRASIVQAKRRWGGLDIVIIVAGISQRSLVSNTLPQVRAHILRVNLEAPIHLIEQLLPHLCATEESQLVVTGSLAGYVATPLRSAYCAAKHGLRAYCEALSFEVPVPHVTLVTPGFIHTDISRHALTADGSPYQAMDANQLQGLSAERCARTILRGMAHKRSEIFVGLQLKGWLILIIRILCPPLYRRIMRTMPLK